MKFTKSLPAKAKAKAKVPIRMIILKTFTFNQCNTCIKMVKKMREAQTIVSVCVSIYCTKSVPSMLLPFNPLISMK